MWNILILFMLFLRPYSQPPSFCLFLGKGAIRIFGLITKIPSNILFPIVAITCIMGVYGINSSYLDLRLVLLFGVVGYILRKLNYPLAPLLIGFILEPLGEMAIRQSLTISNGSWEIFVTRPISILFLILTVISGFLLSYVRKKTKIA